MAKNYPESPFVGFKVSQPRHQIRCGRDWNPFCTLQPIMEEPRNAWRTCQSQAPLKLPATSTKFVGKFQQIWNTWLYTLQKEGKEITTPDLEKNI